MPETTVRLQKFLADAGVCSRRAAEQLIVQGEVMVNGRPAELGQKINPVVDKVVVDGRRVRPPETVSITVAVNKPRGLVCSNDDPHNPRTVFELLPPDLAKHRFFCAGRLDKDSEGLVILTTDGNLAQRLTHPRNLVTKRYHVVLERPFPRDKAYRLVNGILADGERLKVEYANPLNSEPGGGATSWDVHMHHGKKREIRQLFLGLGYPVKRLRRYQIGAFPLKGIPLRGGRRLSSEEIERLFEQPGLTPRSPVGRGLGCIRTGAKAAERAQGKQLAKGRAGPDKLNQR